MLRKVNGGARVQTQRPAAHATRAGGQRHEDDELIGEKLVRARATLREMRQERLRGRGADLLPRLPALFECRSAQNAAVRGRGRVEDQIQGFKKNEQS